LQWFAVREPPPTAVHVSTLKSDSVQRNLIFSTAIKADKSKISVFRVFDREKLNSFPTVNGGFDFDFVHGKRKIEDFRRLCKNNFTSFDFFFHELTNHIVRDVRAFVVEELASGTE
jgi:hypothetical protein